MKKYMKAATFATNQNRLVNVHIIAGIGNPDIYLSCMGSIGGFHPPKNMMTARTETDTIATYSASMKKANLMPLYSVWKPAASVPSSSGRSKGILFISATEAMRKIKNQTGPTGR